MWREQTKQTKQNDRLKHWNVSFSSSSASQQVRFLDIFQVNRWQFVVWQQSLFAKDELFALQTANKRLKSV